MLRAWIAVVAGVVAALTVPVPAGAEFGSASAFTATANARLVQVTFTAKPPIGVDPLLDPGAATAQAQVDSLGVSQAFASSTYPGQSVLTADGSLSTVTDGRVGSEEIPEYPFIASSAYPSRPTDSVEAGPLTMRAESSSLSSAGLATDGLGQAVARAGTEPSTLEASASAETRFGSLRLGKLVQVSGVHSFAAARQEPSGQLQTTSLFEVAGLQVLGTAVSVGPHGLVLGGRPAAPVAPDSGLTALLGALKERGVELSVFPERKVPGGVQAGGLEVRLVQAPPPAVASGVDAFVATITLGGNLATVDNRALPGAAFVDPTTSVPDGPLRPSTAAAGPTAVVGSEPGPGPAQPGTAAGPPPGGGEVPIPDGSPAPPAVPPPVSPTGGESQAALGPEAINAEGLRVRLAGVYPLLVLSVFVAVAVAGSFRRLTGQRRTRS
ncbi:MAG: hypothetical protein QOJ23_4717 [Actinomycetota bacterium]|nr:hypothetical protein [Actinomycetota bacterium]